MDRSCRTKIKFVVCFISFSLSVFFSQNAFSLEISGIVQGDSPVAIINGKIYGVGDTIEGRTIVEIGEDFVNFEDKKGKMTSVSLKKVKKTKPQPARTTAGKNNEETRQEKIGGESCQAVNTHCYVKGVGGGVEDRINRRGYDAQGMWNAPLVVSTISSVSEDAKRRFGMSSSEFERCCHSGFIRGYQKGFRSDMGIQEYQRFLINYQRRGH